MDFKQASEYYQQNYEQWFIVDDFRFKFKKITESDRSEIYLAQEEEVIDEEEICKIYLKIVYSSIIDWQGVKIKDINPDANHEDLEIEIEGFDKDLFDVFLKNNINIVDELFECIDLLQKEYDEYKAKRFKTIVEDIDRMEEAKLYEEMSKHVRKKVNIKYENQRSISIFNRCYDGMSGLIHWDYVLFWSKQLGVKDMETECEMMLVIRNEMSNQDKKKEERKKEIKAKSQEMDILIARKFGGGNRG